MGAVDFGAHVAQEVLPSHDLCRLYHGAGCVLGCGVWTWPAWAQVSGAMLQMWDAADRCKEAAASSADFVDRERKIRQVAVYLARTEAELQIPILDC